MRLISWVDDGQHGSWPTQSFKADVAYEKYHFNKRRLAKREAPKINHLHAVAGWLRLGVLRTPL
jgi:hypothetical protein